MPVVSFRLPKELYEEYLKLKKTVNWPEYLRKAVIEEIERQRRLKAMGESQRTPSS